MPANTDTICALATPGGTGAIGMVRISGPGACGLAEAICGCKLRPRYAHYGDFRNRQGTLLDSAVFTFFVGPASYTGEDTLEISFHGNPFIAQRILEDLLARGCRSASPGEFSQRAFLNGKMDLSQAEAVMDLIQARSDQALAAANRQLQGALGKQLNILTNRLLRVLAGIEAHIDFPEEDLPAEDLRSLQGELAMVREGSDRLLATGQYGERLREGIRTVLIGPTNAGKSSLLNRILGWDRALVSSEPGTTRDFIEEELTLGGQRLRMIDTAGLNPSPTGVEALGIERTFERIDNSDLVVLVLDASVKSPALPDRMRATLVPDHTIVVLNKSDLVNGSPLARSPLPSPPLMVSALAGTGLENLERSLSGMAERLMPPIDDNVLAINARHADALGRASGAIGQAQAKLRDNSPAELVASDLHEAMDAFGEICGKIDNERILDEIFSTFCIGK